MFNNNLIYRFYYGWWKNIDKPIFLIISLLLVVSPPSYSSLLEEDVPYHDFDISDEFFYPSYDDKSNKYRNDLLTLTEGFDDFWPDEERKD